MGPGSQHSKNILRVKPPYGGGEGVCVYSLVMIWACGPQGPARAWAWDPRPWEQKAGTGTWRASGPRLGLGLGRKPGNVAGLPQKHDSTMKMKSFFSCHIKSHQKPCVFEPRLEKCIKNLVFLKVRTRNCVRGRSFQITKRSTSIGVSNSNKNDGARFAQPCPVLPGRARLS